jgi:hypothetical protein
MNEVLSIRIFFADSAPEGTDSSNILVPNFSTKFSSSEQYPSHHLFTWAITMLVIKEMVRVRRSFKVSHPAYWNAQQIVACQ